MGDLQRGRRVEVRDDMGVAKNRGILPPKMDGENHGKPY